MAITLKAMRVNRGMSQTDAALAMKVNPATISNWETGKTMPSRKMLNRICTVYKCEIGDIFFPVKFTPGD